MLLNEGRCVGDPLARYARVSPSERGRLNPVKFRDTILPLVRGRAAEGGRGSLTQNVALSNTPFSPRFCYFGTLHVATAVTPLPATSVAVAVTV